MRTVLLPTDFWYPIWHAIDYALERYKGVRTIFHFLHADVHRVFAPFKKNEGQWVEMQKKAIIKNADTELGELLEKVKVRTRNPKHGHKPISACTSLVDIFSDAEHDQIKYQR